MTLPDAFHKANCLFSILLIHYFISAIFPSCALKHFKRNLNLDFFPFQGQKTRLLPGFRYFIHQ